MLSHTLVAISTLFLCLYVDLSCFRFFGFLFCFLFFQLIKCLCENVSNSRFWHRPSKVRLNNFEFKSRAEEDGAEWSKTSCTINEHVTVHNQHRKQQKKIKIFRCMPTKKGDERFKWYLKIFSGLDIYTSKEPASQSASQLLSGL